MALMRGSVVRRQQTQMAIYVMYYAHKWIGREVKGWMDKFRNEWILQACSRMPFGAQKIKGGMGWMLIACGGERDLQAVRKVLSSWLAKTNLSQVPKRRCTLSLDHPSWLQKHSHSFIFIHHSVPRGFLT